MGPLFHLLDRSESRFGEKDCIDFKGKHYTYREIGEKVRRFAAALQALGVVKGTKVGLYMPNCPQFIISYFAILKAGGVVVNYNPLYSPRELEHQIKDSGTEIIISLQLEMLYSKLKPFIGTTCLRKVILSQLTEALPAAKAALFMVAKAREIAHPVWDANHLHFAELLKTDPAHLQLPTINAEEDIAVLQYTGGTTGVPKGVMLTHANLTANVEQCLRWLRSEREGSDVMMGVLPFFHVFAMTVCMNFAIAGGMKILLHPRFDLKALLEDVHHKRPTLMPGVSTMFGAIVNYRKLKDYDLTSIKICLSGGGPLPREIKEQFEALTGCKLIEGYGLSESSPVVSCNPVYEENKTGSIGQPLPGTILEIVDKDDKTTLLPQGETGEICVRGPQVMAGYWNKPEETDHVLRQGRLYTGDVGYMDEQGYFYIVDRLKEMIISGGYNIYPRELEEVLYLHEAVAECAVIGIPHPLRVQVPKAFIVVKEGKTLHEDDLKAHMKAKLSAYAQPAAYEFRQTLPKSIIGKILKKELLAEELNPSPSPPTA